MLQNTYTNADKLLEAAEQLAQTGECDPEEIYQAAHQLEDRIQDFVRRVEQRKVLLDMSVAFHTHVKEVSYFVFVFLTITRPWVSQGWSPNIEHVELWLPCFCNTIPSHGQSELHCY